MAETAWKSQFIDLEQFHRLVDLAGVLRNEAERCAEARSFHAACVMEVAALEAALTVQACIFEPELREQGAWPKRRDSPLKWTLGTLLHVDEAAGWLSDGADTAEFDLADVLRLAKDARNLAVHPGRHAREWPQLKQLSKREYKLVHLAGDQAFSGLGAAISRSS